MSPDVPTTVVKLRNGPGENYQEVFGYAAPGRRAIAGVRYTLD